MSDTCRFLCRADILYRHRREIVRMICPAESFVFRDNAYNSLGQGQQHNAKGLLNNNVYKASFTRYSNSWRESTRLSCSAALPDCLRVCTLARKRSKGQNTHFQALRIRFIDLSFCEPLRSHTTECKAAFEFYRVAECSP